MEQVSETVTILHCLCGRGSMIVRYGEVALLLATSLVTGLHLLTSLLTKVSQLQQSLTLYGGYRSTDQYRSTLPSIYM